MKIPKARLKQAEVSRNLRYVTTQHGYALNDHFSDTSVTPAQLLISVMAAAVLIFVTFFLKPFNFWLDIILTMTVLVFLALAWSEVPLSRRNINLESIIIGAGAGMLLYLLCLGGGFLLELLWPAMHNYTAEIYDLAYSVPLAFAVILAVIVAIAEEIFWRGFIMRNFQAYLGTAAGIIAAVAVYALVHIWAFNPLLILAAAIGGAFWGILYNWRGNLFIPILAHVIWCVGVLAVYPIG